MYLTELSKSPASIAKINKQWGIKKRKDCFLARKQIHRSVSVLVKSSFFLVLFTCEKSSLFHERCIRTIEGKNVLSEVYSLQICSYLFVL